MRRGLRNNNPGNIRISPVKYLGEAAVSADPSFKEFKTILWGYRAVFVLLHTYFVKHSLSTIRGMINRYAPSNENDTQSYIKAVSIWAGIDPDRILNTLDGTTMIPIVSAISRIENGVPAIEADVEAAWTLFISTYKL